MKKRYGANVSPCSTPATISKIVSVSIRGADFYFRVFLYFFVFWTLLEIENLISNKVQNTKTHTHTPQQNKKQNTKVKVRSSDGDRDYFDIVKLKLNTSSRGRRRTTFFESHGKQHGGRKGERTNPMTVQCHT